MCIREKLKAPWRITFDTNPDLCNIQCIMCEEHSPYAPKKKNPLNRLMDFTIIEKVLEETQGHGVKEVIPSTMGEPLLYPKFQPLLALLKDYDLKLNLTTNGTFPKLGARKWAELILPILSDVKISINGATKATCEKIMQGINFNQLLANIQIWCKLRDEIYGKGNSRPTISFQVTYMEQNLEEFPDLLRLAIEMGIDRLKGHHLWITHPQLESQSLRRDEKSIGRWNKMVDTLRNIANSQKDSNGRKIQLDNVYKLSNLGKSKIPAASKFLCPFLGREAWIAWDGTFNVCCSPDNLRQSLGDFGNVKNTRFLKLWNSPQYKVLLENWGQYEVCKLCNMKRPTEDIKNHEGK